MHFEPDLGFHEPPLAFRPAPASSAQERLARLRLIRSRRVGPATYLRLMAEHRSASSALEALPEVARAAGVTDYSPCPEGVALAEMKAAKRVGARLLCLGDAAFPNALAQTSDGPPLLWAMGDLRWQERPMIAVVGTRNATSLGARMARRLSADLGQAGFTIVSGLARGIDALAHSAALDTGTIAVQAGGVDVIYPPENADLADQIAKQGLRLSEQPIGLDPQARHFPRRNRIVAGLAQAVIVVEAAAKSGSLITARMAAEYGREVMAVPGHPIDTRAAGGNLLIKDGACLIRNADDVLEALDHNRAMPTAQPPRKPAPTLPTAAQPLATSAISAKILALLSHAPQPEDHLAREIEAPPSQTSRALSDLEFSGQITRLPGGLLSLAASKDAS